MNLENYDTKVSLDPLVSVPDLAKATPGNVEVTLKTPEEQAESDVRDYWIYTNPLGLTMYNPELAFNEYETGYSHSFDYDDPEFKALFDKATPETKRAMITASNKSDAIKIAMRRKEFEKSQQAIAQDGLMTQLVMGALPAIITPSSLLPVGTAMKTAQLAKSVSRMSRAMKVGAVGAVTGAVVNITDEAVFDVQGMPTGYVSAGMMGAVFGGGLGTLAGALSGPGSAKVVNALDPENDSYTKDFQQDPNVILQYDENGKPLIPKTNTPRMEPRNIGEAIFETLTPDFMKSVVHKAYQSASSTLRDFTSRLATATVSRLDAEGKPIVAGKTAVDVQRTIDGIHGVYRKEQGNFHAQAVQEGYDGDIEAFVKDSKRVYSEVMVDQREYVNSYVNKEMDILSTDIELKRQAELEGITKKAVKEEINAKYDDILEQKRVELTDKALETYEIDFNKFSKGNKYLAETAKATQNYFNKILEQAKAFGMEELMHINKNELYMPRMFDFKKLKDGTIKADEAIDEITQALITDSRNDLTKIIKGGRRVPLTATEIRAQATDIYQKLTDESFNPTRTYQSFNVSGVGIGGGRLKAKKLYLNDNALEKIVINDVDSIIGSYHYGMRGRLGLQYALGVDTPDKAIKLLQDEMRANGEIPNAKDMENFRNLVSDISGELRMNALSDTPGWSFARNVMSYNSLRLGGGFGANQLIELASTIFMTDFRHLFNGRLGKSFTKSADLLYNDFKKGDDFTEFLINSGFMQDTLLDNRVNRFSDTEAGFNTGVLEAKLQNANSTFMKYNGMRYFVSVTEDFVGSTVVTRLKKGDVDVDTLARWGLTEADAKRLGSKLDKVTQGDSWKLGELDQADLDKLQLAVARGIEEVVVQGDSIHLPNFMKAPSAMTKLFTQFMRFPMIANEVLLRRGFTQEQSKMIGGAIASMMTYAMLKKLREDASVAVGLTEESDRKYNFMEDEEAFGRTMLESLNYTAQLGFLTTIGNMGLTAIGEPKLGRDWSSGSITGALVGPSGALIEDLSKTAISIKENGLSDERTYQKAKSFLPGMNLPIISEGLKAIAEEYGD